jgi:hypothetical protein
MYINEAWLTGKPFKRPEHKIWIDPKNPLMWKLIQIKDLSKDDWEIEDEYYSRMGL